MLLTDSTYFDNEIFIPNLPECQKDLDFLALFTDWERECLRLVLGECVFQELLNQLEFDSSTNLYKLKDNTDAKWKNLLFGHSYTQDEAQRETSYPWYGYRGCRCGCQEGCDKLHWKGIWEIHQFQNQVNGEVKTLYRNKSLVAYYIYWKWSMDTTSLTTGSGEKQSDTKNTTPVSNKRKRVNAFNYFRSWTQHCPNGGRVSLYYYLSDFKGLFPDWEGQCFKPLTTWY